MGKTICCGMLFKLSTVKSIGIGFFILIGACICLGIGSTSLMKVTKAPSYVKWNCKVSNPVISCAGKFDIMCKLNVDYTYTLVNETINGTSVAVSDSTRLYVEHIALPRYTTIGVDRNKQCWYNKNDLHDIIWESPSLSTYATVWAYVLPIIGAILVIAGITTIVWVARGTRKEYTTYYEMNEAAAGGTPFMYQSIPDDEFGTSSKAAHMDGPRRTRFLLKIYGILTCQLLITVALIFFNMMYTKLAYFYLTNVWFYWLNFGLTLAFLITLFFVHKIRIWNLVVLSLFSVCLGFSVGSICTIYSVSSVLSAAAITMIIFLSLTAFTLQTKINFNFLGAGLILSLWALLWVGLFFFVFFPSPLMSALYSAFGVILFTLFILYDTSALMTIYEEDEYILAAVNLYLDIINLFLMILRLMGGRR